MHSPKKYIKYFPLLEFCSRDITPHPPAGLREMADTDFMLTLSHVRPMSNYYQFKSSELWPMMRSISTSTDAKARRKESSSKNTNTISMPHWLWHLTQVSEVLGLNFLPLSKKKKSNPRAKKGSDVPCRHGCSWQECRELAGWSSIWV